MATELTPRFTLPDPDRAPMTPLPTELLAHVLKLAQEGDSAQEQLRTRVRFERVCRGWKQSVPRWAVVGVNGITGVRKLLRSIAEANDARAGSGSAECVGLAVKSIYLRLRQKTGKNKPAQVMSLLSKLGKVESVEFEVGFSGLSGSYCLTADVANALGKLSNVKHFKLGGAPYVDRRNHLKAADLSLMISHWPKLESLTLVMCNVDDPRKLRSIFSKASYFNSLTLIDNSVSVSHVAAFIVELPLTTRSIHVESTSSFHAYGPSDLRHLNTNAHALQISNNLHTFTFIEGREFADYPYRQSRGGLNNFIANLDSVTDLAISPLSLSNVGSLANLPKVTHAQLLVERTRPSPAVASSEVVAFLIGSRSLEEIVVSTRIAEKWDQDELQAVMDAAEPNIDLVWA